MLWAENRLGHAREIGDRPSVAKQRERGIFRPNQYAITHSFSRRPGVRACCGSKIDRGVPRWLGIIPFWSI
ncbi:hypothetical protein P3S68_031724 [Capsicum galapagoense]